MKFGLSKAQSAKSTKRNLLLYKNLYKESRHPVKRILCIFCISLNEKGIFTYSEHQEKEKKEQLQLTFS